MRLRCMKRGGGGKKKKKNKRKLLLERWKGTLEAARISQNTLLKGRRERDTGKLRLERK